MRLAFAVLCLLVPLVGAAERPLPPLDMNGAARAALSLPFSSSGGLIPEDAGTVSHVYWLQPRTNLILRSEQFDNGSWTKAGITAAAPTVTADQAIAPDGTLSADKIDFAATAGGGQRSSVYQNFTLATPGIYTISVWLQGVSASGTVYLEHAAASGAGANVPCAVTAGVWSRCTTTFTFTTTTGGGYMFLGPDPASGGQPATQAAISAYVWGAQAEAGPTATPYIQTVASTSTVSQKGNALTRSEHFDLSPWTATGTNVAAPTVTPNVTTLLSPTGDYGEVEQVDFAATASAGDRSILTQTFTSLAVPYTASVYARAVSGSGTLYVETGSAGAYSSVPCTVTSSTWTRCFVQRIHAATTSTVVIGNDSLAGSGQPTAQPALSVYVYGAQLNPGSWPDEYEPTAATATLRGPLIDTKGNAWTVNGTIPIATSGPLFPAGFGDLPKTGAGSFSAANYYSLGAGSDVLDFAGDFTTCFVFTGAGTASFPVLAKNSSTSAAGYSIWASATQVGLDTYTGATATAAQSVAAGQTNVACFGRSGTTIYAKANLATTTTATQAAPVAATAAVMRLGSDAVNGLAGPIFEAYFSTTPWSESAVVQIQQRILGITGTKGEVGTYTRATPATYQPLASTQQIFLAPSGAPRVTEQGYLSEPARTNWVLQSGTITTANAATAPWALNTATAVTGSAGGFLDGVGGWHSITSTANTGSVSQNVTAGATTTTVTGSTWAKKASAGYASVLVSCGAGAVTVCTCVRSDGGTCTATANSPLSGYCKAEVSNLATIPVRLSALTTCASTSTSYALFLVPGQYGTAVGTTDFSGAQLETGTYPTTYIPTVGSTVARNADSLSYTNPLRLQDRRWCVAGTWQRGERSPWDGQYPALLTMGSLSAANTVGLYLNNTNMTNILYDGAAASRSLNYAHGYSAGSSKAITSCSSQGRLNAFSNGVQVGFSATGGTGLFGAAPGNVNIGWGAGGTTEFGGYSKNLKLCVNASRPSECR
jgi:hypothetical protein